MTHPAAPLRVGVCGLGTMGRNHLRNLVARNDVAVVALADPAADALRRATQAARGARGFASAGEMLAEEALDALIVATPTTLHARVASEALERGVSVLVEKPLASTVAEARALVALAARTRVLLQVGHVERFNPAVESLAERLAAGELGRIFSVKTMRAGPLPARIRDVGVAVDLATHDVDVMCHLVGERPVRAYAEMTRQIHTDHEDLLYGLLSFPGGALGQLDVNWLTPEKQRAIVVLGEAGMYRLDYLRQSLTFTRAARELRPTYLDGYAPTFSGESVELPVQPAEPLARELASFLEAVREGRPPVVTGDDGMWAVALAAALLRSALEHVPVEVHAIEVH